MAGDAAGEIARVAIVGNSAMLALLTESPGTALLGADTWDQPLECRLRETESWRRSWHLSPEARIEIVQPLAGFVGSDLLAGLIATRLDEGPPGSLFIDFGTNTELALWDGATLWVTSAAGGPAFEGSGLSCGWPAEAGAVFRVDLADDPAVPAALGVIGGGEARGLCGSGLVDAVAWLRRSGLLSAAGRFAASVGTTGFALAPDLVLSKRDIDVFQRAKAAVAAAAACLFEQAGPQPPPLNRLCIGGAFGRTLGLEAAFETGLLPRLPAERVELFGQAALAGCSRLLFAPNPQTEQKAPANRLKVINMASAPVFEDRFIDHLRLRPFQLK